MRFLSRAIRANQGGGYTPMRAVLGLALLALSAGFGSVAAVPQVEAAAVSEDSTAQPEVGGLTPTVALTLGTTSFVASQAPSATVQVSCDYACGSVDFRVDGFEWATVPLNASGAFITSSLPILAVGSHTLQVFYQGNAAYAATASNAVNFAVVPDGSAAPSVVLTVGSTSFVPSLAPSATVVVGCASACGEVDFRIDGSEWATVPLNAGGAFITSSLPVLAVGAHTLQVFYLGNAAYAAAASNAVNLTVLPDGSAAPSVVLTLGATLFLPNQAPSSTVQVSCASACGEVDFRIDGIEWATVPLNASGAFITSSLPILAAGGHTLQVFYLGNAAYAAAASNAIAFTVGGPMVTGSAYGGAAPISGAHVYLFAANTTGYGQASVSLLSAASTGSSDSLGAYVLTGGDGSFSLGGYSCVSGQQLYLYVLGGDSGFGPNAASGLLAALGNCPSASESVTVNEVTTVATAYALAGFMTDPLHLSSSGTVQALSGVANAFATVANLVNLSTGVALATTPAGNGTVAQVQIDMLADILATCVESNGGTPCSSLFGLVTPGGGTAPTDTAGAVLDIAAHPGNQVSALAGLARFASAPFQPTTSFAPSDWTVSVVYSTPVVGTFPTAYSSAIDASGDLWIAIEANSGTGISSTLTELSNTGAPLSGANGFPIPGDAVAISIDPAGDLWVANGLGVVKVSSGGSVVSGSGYYAGSEPTTIAIDGSGDAWVGNSGSVGLFKLGNDGTNLSGSSGFATGTATSVFVYAIDPSGDAWVEAINNSFLNGYTTMWEYNNSGSLLSPAGGYPGGLGPTAFDSSGDAWTNIGNNTLVERSSTGALLSGASGFYTCNATAASPLFCFGTFPGASEPISIAVDGLGNAWAPAIYYGPGTRQYANGIVELSNAGAILSGNVGYATSGSEGLYPSLLQVDSSGNLWGVSPTTTTELIGVAAPTVTPLSLGIQNGTLGTRP